MSHGIAQEQVGKTEQRDAVSLGFGTAAHPVGDQPVYGLLQHPFFVAEDDIGNVHVDQLPESFGAEEHVFIKGFDIVEDAVRRYAGHPFGGSAQVQREKGYFPDQEGVRVPAQVHDRVDLKADILKLRAHFSDMLLFFLIEMTE